MEEMLGRFRPEVLNDLAASRGRVGDDDTLESPPLVADNASSISGRPTPTSGGKRLQRSSRAGPVTDDRKSCATRLWQAVHVPPTRPPAHPPPGQPDKSP